MGTMGSYSKRVAKALRQAAIHIVDDRGEPPQWPMNIVETLWYLSKYYPFEMHRTIRRLRERGLSEKDIAELFITPTRLTYVFHQSEFPIEGLTPEEGGSLFESFMDFVAHFRKEDIYCEKSRNILKEDDQIQKDLQAYKFVELETTSDSESFRSIVGKLNATMWLYSEFIQAGKHPYSHEFHGPYPISNGDQLLIRHYYDLKPLEVWPYLEDVPYEIITTFEVYGSETRIGYSFFNHSESTSSFPQHLKRFSVVAGKEGSPVLDIGGLANLQRKFQAAIEQGNSYVADFTKSDWNRKLLELHFYYLKPHKEVLGDPWEPPDELYDFVASVEPDGKIGEFMTLVGKAFAGPSEPIEQELVNLFLSNVYSPPESEYLSFDW